ncbi:LytR/AlgR family response regulator transcription factor [Noviherbaspirillum autotrophicum]|uniref:Transcriptional regulator n=1 Tax=Noviherbaspirillum autotrophicum TaxID=709839 RepID=A0A0C1Y651_9BURK|nr:LytTR family DNA-binding domain-containing protein [Noviherbaspirillum autotrophicum]KIF82393.1 transcriptional regulator [Noviherbaspirillum autotrophicum]
MTPRLFIVDDEAPARARLKTLLADIDPECPHELVGEAGGAQQALDAIAQCRPDIVLLDVQMPGMNGIELASHLSRSCAPAPAIIFVTAYDEYALKAFEVHALDYLLKPVRAARLADAIRRAAALRGPAAQQRDAIDAAASAMPSKRQHFSVQERGRVLLVPVNDVIYLKAELKYVTVRTRMQEYLIEESLTSIEDEMGATFVRVHRNALVARHAIVGVERGAHPVDAEGDADKASEQWQVILRDVDERLPISRRQWPVVKALVR